MRYRDDSTKGLVPFIILIIVAAFGFHACTTSVAQGNTHTETVTICGKDVVNRGNPDMSIECILRVLPM